MYNSMLSLLFLGHILIAALERHRGWGHRILKWLRLCTQSDAKHKHTQATWEASLP